MFLELKAKIPDVEGCITLSQCAPRTTVFMAACVKPKTANAIKAGKEYGVEVHEYATIEKDGSVCKDIGPEFNPFNVRF